ncbi:MAG: metallophosphoesterase [bacterium]
MLIAHTSDMHGKLSAKKAKRLFHLGQSGALLLDSGDSLSAGNLDIRWRERTLKLMSLAGYTAGALGNREFHPFPSFLKWKLRDAVFPFLSANLLPEGNMEKIRPYILLEREGYRIAIVGLTLPQVRGFWEKLLPLRFSEPISCGIAMEEKLEGICDFIVFLTHIGIGRDVKLARMLKKPSIILGGHNHILLEEPIKINDCYILHSGCYARYVGLIEIEKGRVKGWVEKL